MPNPCKLIYNNESQNYNHKRDSNDYSYTVIKRSGSNTKQYVKAQCKSGDETKQKNMRNE